MGKADITRTLQSRRTIELKGRGQEKPLGGLLRDAQGNCRKVSIPIPYELTLKRSPESQPILVRAHRQRGSWSEPADDELCGDGASSPVEILIVRASHQSLIRSVTLTRWDSEEANPAIAFALDLDWPPHVPHPSGERTR